MTQDPNSTANLIKTRLRQVLAEPDAFSHFMEHLVREFSHEHLLFLLEVTQFKIAVRNRMLMTLQHPSSTDLHNLKEDSLLIFPTSAPKSELVRGFVTDSVSAEFVARKLYLKYIVKDCELEVNVSHRCKQRLQQLFGITRSNSMKRRQKPKFRLSLTATSSVSLEPELVPFSVQSPSAEMFSVREQPMHVLENVFDDAYMEVILLLEDCVRRFLAEWSWCMCHLCVAVHVSFDFD